jgi:hypothetical protein
MMRATWTFFVVSALTISSLFAQPCGQIDGVVIDASSGQSLPGAHVRTASDWKNGVSTSDDGRFRIAVGPSDTLVVSFIGYQTTSYLLATSCSVTIGLTSTSQTMADITITAPRLIVEEFKTSGIKKMDIYLNPAAKADPLLAVSTLPSATTLDESANVSLRGSTTSETGIFINNVPVYDAIRYSQLNGIGTFSIFNTAIIDNVQVFPGNPPLEYGNTASGLISLETDTHIPEKKSTQLAFSLASVGGTFQTAFGKRTSLQLFTNYQPSAVLKAFNRTALADIHKFNSVDGGVHLTHRFKNNVQLRLYNYSLSESYTFHYKHPTYDGDFNQGKSRNLMIMNLHKRKGTSEFSLNQGWSMSRTNYDYSSSWIDLNQQDLYTSVNYRYYGKTFDVKTGVSHDNRYSGFAGTFPQYDYAIGEQHPMISEKGNARLQLNEAYVYIKVSPLSWLTAGQGLRAILPGDGRSWAFSHQSNLRAVASGSLYFLFSTGRYHQTIFGQSESEEQVRSAQQSLDAVYHNNRVEASASLFHKTIFRTNNTKEVTGGEFYVKYAKGRKIQAQVSLTSLSAEVTEGIVKYRDQYDIHYYVRGNAQYGFNQKWLMSAILLLRQGSFVLPISSVEYDEVVGAYKPQYYTRDLAERLPSYSSVALNLSRMTAFSDNIAAVMFASVNNVLNRENTRGYYYTEDYSGRVPVSFSARTVYFGMVVYF